jgi:hypothetical protein
MAFINDRVFDNGLTVLDTEANRLDICSQEPTTYTEATSTYTLGNKTSLTVNAPQDGVSNGRRVRVSAITDGTVTATGTATHWAVVDTSNSRLLATGALSASQAVTNGNVFTLTEFSVTIPDAA